MTKRILAAIFGAFLFAIITPIAYAFVIGVPFGNFYGILILAVLGLGIGATLGALFPDVFGFVFSVFLDI